MTMSLRPRIIFPRVGVLCALALCASTSFVYAAESNASALANKIIKAVGVKGGLIVHVGCGDGKLTSALRINDRYQVHGLDTNPADVDKARANIQQAGVYGNVAVDRLQGSRLPYVDNLVNLVVSEDLGDVPMKEVVRVLAPNGVAYIKKGDAWTKTVKPRPKNIDVWTHYMHDSTGNAVAHDSVVGPPRHLQWIGSPSWSRHHDRMASMSALVSTGDRIFYIMDEGSRVSIQLPPKWTLVARDAFNGTILWKQPIKTWHNHLWPLKSGPTQLARRLVAVGDRVYVTLGFAAPLTALDASTGKILRTYENTGATEEVIVSDGVLFLLVNKGKMELSKFAPVLNVGDQQRVGKDFLWNEGKRQIMAVDAKSGKLLWKKESRVSPITLCADNERVLFHNGTKLVCLNRNTGKENWTAPASRRSRMNFNFGPKIVIYKDVVLYAGGDRKMKAFSVDKGKELWEAPHAQSGYQSPEDLLISGGLVWSAPTRSTQDSGEYTGRDPRTGKIKSKFKPDVKTYWFHHRCYMGKATDRFLLPSRTGIEFVDTKKEHWDINHWVRGGCLYGIMPCNGLVYTPPHNCACYPEAKLYGFNALAPASSARKVPRDVPDAGRLERGPAYGKPVENTAGPNDWPTYRHDITRSGFTKAKVPADLKQAWETKLGGKLSSVVVSGGKLFVAKVNAHTLYALDAGSGKTLWQFTTGGRVDSPPTIHEGRVLFGSADGHVYCVRAADGKLIWRFRAAPQDSRLTAFEQLESVWPVHGSVLVQNGAAFFVAGRSNFLDGGLRFFRLDPKTGKKLAERILDERNPETGKNIQDQVKILNMPVGLPDILTGDGNKHVFMRSQRFDLDGKRQLLSPHSGDPAGQGSVQRGEISHLFAPMGYLDDTWFHRSYWVYGRSFAGGHAGYYQAGKYAPSGRILVFNDDTVYGFGRKPQYYRWTTIIEHQLFAADKEAPELKGKVGRRGGSMISFENTKSLNPAGKPLTVEAWVKADRPSGVIVARGGPSHGYALILRGGSPRFVVRIDGKIHAVTAKESVRGKWAHIAGVLTKDKKLQIYVNGQLSAEDKSSGLIVADPQQALEIGADALSAVGNYKTPFAFTGIIDDVKIFYGSVTAEEIQKHYADPKNTAVKQATLVLSCSFDKGDAVDASGNKNHGKVQGVKQTKGKFGTAMRFVGRSSRRGGSLVKHHWTQDLPLFVRAMALADKHLFIVGPPDIIDEEQTFARLSKRDAKVQKLLAAQDAALRGEKGALLRVVSTKDGSKLAEYKLTSLPIWDGMAVANGKLYLSTTDGKVICFGAR